MRRGHEASLLGLLLAMSAALQLLILPTLFVGPDTRKFLEIANKQMHAGFWTDPSAFDYNYWAVGYPTFLSALLRLLGNDIRLVQIVQVMMAVALAAIAWTLAYSLGSRNRLIVAGVTAFHPGVWWMARNGGYEILLAVLLCSALATIWWGGSPPAWKSRRRAWAVGVVSGICLALAVFAQSKALAVVPILLYLGWRWGRATITAQVIAFLLTLAPWMLRNRVVLGTLNPLGTNGPINVWIGNNPEAVTGGFMEPPDLPDGASDFIPAATQFVLSQPEAAFALFLRRAVRLLEPVYNYPEVDMPGFWRVIGHYSTIVVTVFIAASFLAYLGGRLWLPSKDLPAVGPLAAFVSLFYVIHLPFLSEARFMTPVIPATVTVAIAAIAQLITRWRKSSHSLEPLQTGTAL